KSITPLLPTIKQRSEGFDMARYIEHHRLPVKVERPWGKGTMYDLEECPFNPEHRNSALTLSHDGTPGFNCFHDSCARRTIKDVFAKFSPPGMQTPRQETSDFSIESIPSIWSFDAKVTWLVEDFIQEGAVTMICGESGVGKSFFALAL